MSEGLYFIPFSDTVIKRYESCSQIPSQGGLNPRLFHGEIFVTLTAKTPVIVSGGNRVVENGVDVATFSRNAEGHYRIPGSSLRGLIRQNMQILGLGAICTGRGEDIPDGYRNFVSGGREPKEGLPQNNRKKLLDYPRSIMGFVGYFENGKKNICCRSRIGVGDLTAVGTPRESRTIRIRQMLPRQSNPDFITETGNGRFRLNGFRQYPPKQVLPEACDSRRGICPLQEGTQFTGSIRYRNLHEDELGLLLWCLRLEEGCLQTMGMGKAAGYGQMELRIDALVEYQPDHLYSALTAGGSAVADPARRVDELIRAYQKYASRPECAGINPAETERIRKFMELRRDKTQTRNQPVPSEPAQPTNKELRRKAKQAGPQASHEDMQDWRAMLNQRYQKN